MAEVIEICTWKGCSKAATHRYRWEWGEEGNVCEACITLMHQAADSLQRKFTTTPLNPSAEAPLTRSERTQLIAAKLSAEAEADEIRLRSHQLYTSNVDLTAQVQTLKMREREHAGQMEAKESENERLAEALEKRERELAEATQELQRLTVLAQFKPPAEETSRVGEERGLQPQSKRRGPTPPPAPAAPTEG
jgi:seryl-tRNA synthetase